jgi:hypothetical protein
MIKSTIFVVGWFFLACCFVQPLSGQPVFSVAPTSLHFGNVPVGDMKVDSVTVSNTGTTTLLLTNATTSNPNFNFLNGFAFPIMIPSGGNVVFLVSFSPAFAGPHSGNLTFTHDAPGSPSSVSVSGFGGIAPPVYSLTVNAVNGSVTRNPDLTVYDSGMTVQLTAIPDPGYLFVAWSGDVNATVNPLAVVMNSDMNITATFAPSSGVSIVGVKFADINGNGVRDAEDVGIGGWKIGLYHPADTNAVAVAVTNNGGQYFFNTLPPGTYEVRETHQPKWTQTYPPFLFYTLTIDGSGTPHTNIDFGNYRLVNRDTSKAIVVDEVIAGRPDIAAIKAFELPPIVLPPSPGKTPMMAGDALPVGTIISTWDSTTSYVLTSEKYFYWLDLTGDLKFAHPCMFVLVDKITGVIDSVSTSWWPVITIPGALMQPGAAPLRIEKWNSWDDRATSPDLFFGSYNGMAPPVSASIPAYQSRHRIPSGTAATNAAAILIGGKAESPTELATWQHDLDSVYYSLVSIYPPAVDPSAVYVWNNTTVDSLDAFLSYVRTRDTLFFYFTGHGDSSRGGGIVLNREGGLITRVTLSYDELATVLFDSLNLQRLHLLFDASKSGTSMDDFLRPVYPMTDLVTSTDRVRSSRSGIPTDSNSVYTREWRLNVETVPLPPGIAPHWRELNDSVRAHNYDLRIDQNPLDTSNAPYFAGDRPSFIFPNIAVGQVSTLDIDVTNEGWISMEIDSIRSSDPAFSIVGADTITLKGRSLPPPFEEKTFTLQFAPTTPGLHLATISFYHNGVLRTNTIAAGGTALAPQDTMKYRTFVQDSLLAKGIRKKAYSVNFSVPLTNNTVTTFDGVRLKFNQSVTITDSGGFTSVTGGGKEWTFGGKVVAPESTVIIRGRGSKGKSVTVSNWWWRLSSSEGTKQPKFVPTGQQLLLPMPTSGNLRDSLFKQGAFGVNGMLIGIAKTDSPKAYGWMRYTKGTNLQKGLVHTGRARPFDTLTVSPYKKFVKEQKNLKITKYNNHLAGELIALKLSIAASAMGKTPIGLGELVYDDSAGNLLNGLMIKSIVQKADSAMTLYAAVPSYMYTVFDTTIRRINLAFSGPLDTISFGTSMVFTGVRTPLDAGFIHANPSMPPVQLKPDYAAGVPERFELYQNYPNPFNPVSMIVFNLPDAATVTLRVYNILGQEVATLFDREEMDDGEHEIEFDAAGLASGVYFYRMTAKTDERQYVDVRKMMLMK